ncbi:MAG: hypothetical protein V1766_03240, partial [Pseudomonadota bacterium]
AAGSARTPLIGGARATPERARRADAQQPTIGRMAVGQASISERSVLSMWMSRALQPRVRRRKSPPGEDGRM